MDDDKIIDRIKELVHSDLPKLSPLVRAWAEAHLAQPRPVILSLNENGQGEITLWLVTDHVGSQDASYRVVFDLEREKFGLEMKMANDVNWFMGLYGGFAEAVDAI